MPILYGQLHVDEKYSPILEPNLYYNSVFADGKTFTSKFETGPAGGIFVRKLATTAAAVGTPGRDFTDEAVKDSLIPIVFNNNFQKSKKIYGVQAKSVNIALANENLSIATQEVSEGWNQGGLACLVQEGTASATTTAITAKTVKADIIAARKEIVTKKGSADVIICSPAVYAAILEQAGAEFVPQSNEFVNATGQIGKWLGFTVMESSGLAAASAEYYDSTNTKKTVLFDKIDFIMYNHNTFNIISNFDVARIVESENFAGSKAQVELNTAYKVTNPDLVLVRKHA